MINVFLGSRSDMELVKASMRPIFNQLCQDLDIGPGYVRYHVCSAHRNPDDLAVFVKRIIDQPEPQVAIGVAGMAAALPGALAGASKMRIPVIGVPLDEDGIDSCNYMPPGVPVLMAGVGKPGLKNAALAAVQIEGMRSEPISAWLRDYIEANTPPAEFDIDINAD
jgi:phosphoribosylaminoimidazole carboxylase PurE protein